MLLKPIRYVTFAWVRVHMLMAVEKNQRINDYVSVFPSFCRRDLNTSFSSPKYRRLEQPRVVDGGS